MTLILLILSWLDYFPSADINYSADQEVWLVSASSSLRVDGKTNINSFNCVVSSYGKIDTLICDLNKSGLPYYKINSILEIPVVNFDCHHNIMTKDLQKTLKMKEYPSMLIDIKSLNKLPKEAVGGYSLGEVKIFLAGTNKTYSIQFSGKNYINQIEFVGSKTILFSDFGLKPPSKLGGAIKVKDELDVEVRLYLKRAD
ncbi:MAG: hypothetical protein IPO98_16120 [Saprospiraceae bacterium]|nr:hypothetical protein [Saprospiraceae bacterium]